MEIIEKLEEQILNPRSFNSSSKDNLDLLSEDSFPTLPVSAPKKQSPAWAPVATNKRTTVRFEIQSHNLARQQLGKQSSASKVCKDVMTKFKTNIEYSINQNSQAMTFLVSGSQNDVSQSVLHLKNLLTVKTTEVIVIPSIARSSLIGQKGSNLRELEIATCTSIQIPKYTGDESEGDITVTIVGSQDGIEQAKREIDAVVAEKTSNYYRRVSIDRRFHQLIAGPARSNLESLQTTFDVKIHIPRNDDDKSNDFVLVGERDRVLQCEEKLLVTLNELKKTTGELSTDVPKKQHRVIIGVKGENVKDIFQNTGCVIILPSYNDSSEKVTIRGPKQNLSKALQLALSYAHSITFGEFDVGTFVESGKGVLFARYLANKQKSKIQDMETKYSSALYWRPGTSTFDLESKSQSGFDSFSREFKVWVHSISATTTFFVVEIPRALHKFLIGKGGQNLAKFKTKPEWNDQLVDIMVPSQNDESDELILILQIGTLSVDSLYLSIKENLVQEVTLASEIISTEIKINQKYHGRIIGAGGASLKELLEPYSDLVNIKFPGSATVDDTVLVRGPKEQVNALISLLSKNVKEWERFDALIGFTTSVDVPSNYIPQLIGDGGNGGKDIYWIVKAISSIHAETPIKHSAEEKFLFDELSSGNFYHLNFEPAANSIKITGPKSLISFAKKLIQDKLHTLQTTSEIVFNMFDNITPEAEKMLQQGGAETKRQIIRQLIGREGKSLRLKLAEYDVNVHFYKDAELELSEFDVIGKVRIYGKKEGVVKMKNYFEEFANEKLLCSFSTKCNIPKSVLPGVLGRNGAKLKLITAGTSCRVEFDRERDDGTIDCHIVGIESECEKLKNTILETVGELLNTNDVIVRVPIQLHRDFIGSSGSHISTFIEKHGGPDKVKITMPKEGKSIDLNAIVICAHSESHEAIKKDLIAMATSKLLVKGSKFEKLLNEDEENVIKRELLIPKADSFVVFGRNYEFLIDLMKRFGVNIWLNTSSSKPAFFKVIIVGVEDQSTAVETCENELKARVREEVQILVPESLLQVLLSGGKGASDLSKQFKELIGFRYHGCDIFASDGLLKGHSNSFVAVRGSQEKLPEAEQKVKAELENMRKYSIVSEMEIPGILKGFIIGKKGAMINRLREQSNCLIDFSPGEGKIATLVIRGQNGEGIEVAKKLIDEIVNENSSLLEPEKKPDPEPVERPVYEGKTPGLTTKGKRQPISKQRISSMVSTNSREISSNVPVTNASSTEWTTTKIKSPVLEVEKDVPKANGIVNGTAYKLEKPTQANGVSHPISTAELLKAAAATSAPQTIVQYEGSTEVIEEWTPAVAKRVVKAPGQEKNAKKAAPGIAFSSSGFELIAEDSSSKKKRNKKKKKKSSSSE